MPTSFRRLSVSVVFSLGFSLLAASLHAEPVTLMAVKPCSKWLEERKPRNIRWGQTWLLGFLSGYSLSSEENFLVGANPDTLFGWMDTYCKAHPLADISDGAQVLIAELRSDKSKIARAEP